MPTESHSLSPKRVAWPRPSAARKSVPALVAAVPLALGGGSRPYEGRSRFVLTPLTLTLDQFLFLITAALLALGLIMVQSADSRIREVHENWLTQAFSNKNAIHAGLALLAMTLTWRMDYRWLLGRAPQINYDGTQEKWWRLFFMPSTWLVIVTLGFLVAVLVTPFGKTINGARRWFSVGPLGFQPSELAKLSLVVFVSAFAVQRAGVIRSFWKGFLPLVAIFGIASVLVIKEDFGTTVLIAAVVIGLILMAGCRWWHVAMLIPPGVFVVWASIFRDPTSFRYRRMMAFMDPLSDPQGAGYHPLQSLMTIMSGGFWGKGLGNGIQKMGYLPEDNTDFIFAVICEELGFVGAAMVVALFAGFVLVGWRIMSRCNNLFGKMVAFGITAIIGLQAAINIAVVTVSMPTKGIALPLISSGGTGWIMNAAAIGLLMSIERHNRREADSIRHTHSASQGFPVEIAVPAIPRVPATPMVPAVPLSPAAS